MCFYSLLLYINHHVLTITFLLQEKSSLAESIANKESQVSSLEWIEVFESLFFFLFFIFFFWNKDNSPFSSF